MKETQIVGLVHSCKGPYEGTRGVMDFSNVKDYTKMISKCPKCGEIIPVKVKSQIKTAKILEKYEL